jgi:hypothetical protein
VTNFSYLYEAKVFMRFLFLKAYAKLIYFDIHMSRGNFKAFYDKVSFYPVDSETPGPHTVERVCAAMDMACIWYRKEVLCLLRAAATASLLRDCGVLAELVIGTQIMPHKTHAWVAVDGQVVNDKPYMPEIYMVMNNLNH